MRRSVRLTLLGAVCVVGLTGCPPPRETALPESGATLQGTIRYAGEPIQFAQVLVIGGNTSATGRVDEFGTYKVLNVPTGEVKVGVNTSAARGEYQSKMMQSGIYKGPEVQAKGKVKPPLKFVDVPERYFDPDQSGLRTTVAAGANTFDIDIGKEAGEVGPGGKPVGKGGGKAGK